MKILRTASIGSNFTGSFKKEFTNKMLPTKPYSPESAECEKLLMVLTFLVLFTLFFLIKS